MSKNDDRSEVSKATSDLAPKNFTTHQSRLDEEGRRNQPKDASPKKTKKRHAKAHQKDAALRETAGALKPFFSESSDVPNSTDTGSVPDRLQAESLK